MASQLATTLTLPSSRLGQPPIARLWSSFRRVGEAVEMDDPLCHRGGTQCLSQGRSVREAARNDRSCPDVRVWHRLDLNEPHQRHCPDDMWQRLRHGGQVVAEESGAEHG
jgi:hypothetical protein